ncbi:MAG: alpha-L-rhamnosidase N-terminal domain-containing protein, partial [Planctomycetes bacterium]|nr:alpha-L-rhamnosidase N-terminal domain-containing protein [Planctomycetota bacterium]
MWVPIVPAEVRAGIQPVDLRCEHAVDPLGIDALPPRLSWRLESAARGDRQSAYRILAASSPDRLRPGSTDRWDSGRVESDASVLVAYGGEPLRSRERIWWRVRAWDRDGRPSPWSPPALFQMGLLGPADWEAEWITDEESGARGAAGGEPQPAVYLRREVRIEGPVRRATAFASALGLYELRINGRRVGDHVLAPGWTDYRRRVQYQTFDVTDHLREGGNSIGAVLGDGWYAGRIGLAIIVPGGPIRGLYGARPRFALEIDVELADGSRRTIITDGSWRSTIEGPIRRSCLLDGELYDARREMDGWDRSGFDDSAW